MFIYKCKRNKFSANIKKNHIYCNKYFLLIYCKKFNIQILKILLSNSFNESRNLIIKYIHCWILNIPYLLRLRLIIAKNEKFENCTYLSRDLLKLH